MDKCIKHLLCPTQKDAATLMKKVILIYESDKDVYLNIEKNKNCFAPKSGWPDNWKNLYSQFKHWKTGKILAKFKE